MTTTPCRITGVIDNVFYEVVLTGRASKPVVGSKRVAALVAAATGTTVNVTPSGPAHVVDPTNIASVVALLTSATRVRSVEGGPDLGVRTVVGGVR